MAAAAGGVVSYDADSGGGRDATFASRGDHDLNLTAEAETAANRWVRMMNLQYGKVPWPTMAEWLFGFVSCGDDVMGLAPMMHYVSEEAWDRWFCTVEEVLGPGCTPAVLGLATEKLELALAAADQSARDSMVLRAGDLVRVQDDANRSLTASDGGALGTGPLASARRYNEELSDASFLEDATFDEWCGAGVVFRLGRVSSSL